MDKLCALKATECTSGSYRMQGQAATTRLEPFVYNIQWKQDKKYQTQETKTNHLKKLQDIMHDRDTLNVKKRKRGEESDCEDSEYESKFNKKARNHSTSDSDSDSYSDSDS